MDAAVLPLLPAAGEPAVAADWPTLLGPRLVEVSGSAAPARFTLAVTWLLQVQQQGEPVAWIQRQPRLYPPDLQRSGIDLAALVVVQVPPLAGRFAELQAAEILLRSGGFGLVVVDLLDGVPPQPAAWQGRLLGLMRAHAASLLVLTEKPVAADSVGTLCSLRLQPQRGSAGGAFWVQPTVLKNKAGLPFPGAPLRRGGPPGLEGPGSLAARR